MPVAASLPRDCLYIYMINLFYHRKHKDASRCTEKPN